VNEATIKLHQTVLRQLKGALRAYGEWIEDEEAASLTAMLKDERESLDKSKTLK
jgi:hypothetical protein